MKPFEVLLFGQLIDEQWYAGTAEELRVKLIAEGANPNIVVHLSLRRTK